MELEKSWITELHVRMDCTGCAHKLKRTLHGVEGVYDICIDFPQQMITVVGRANPEKLVKAIKKTRKIATICSHKENPQTETNSTETTPEVPPPEPEPTAVPEANPPVEEPTQEVPPALEEKPEPPPQPDEKKEVEEIPMVHHYPRHRNLNLWNNDGNLNYDQVVVPYYYASTATRSYSNYYPSPSLSSYATIVSSPQNYHYTGDYYHNHQQQQQQEHCERGGSDGNHNSISSMFSDENPNACIIV